MRVGVPKEIKNHEYRVGLTPPSVAELVAAGHQVMVETGAGLGIDFEDRDYVEAGATILPDADAVFGQAQMIVKVKEPQPVEIARLRPDHLLFTYLHLAADKPQAEGLMKSGATCIAYETVTSAKGGLPLLKPPYGRITAIDLTKGDIAWQVAHGETPDNIRNHPALKGLKIPRTGRPGNLGPLTTKTLVICGEAGFYTNEYGVRGAMLRAYDKATGEEKGAVYMPAPQSGSPMTYMLKGKQYIVVAIGGGNYSAELVAYRLPGKA